MKAFGVILFLGLIGQIAFAQQQVHNGIYSCGSNEQAMVVTLFPSKVYSFTADQTLKLASFEDKRSNPATTVEGLAYQAETATSKNAPVISYHVGPYKIKFQGETVHASKEGDSFMLPCRKHAL